MARPAWLTSVLRAAFPGRFLMVRLSRVPLLTGWFDRTLFRGDRLFILHKERVIRIGETLEPASHTVLSHSIVEAVVRRSGFRWIMNECICRKASGCRNHPVELGCLFMGEAVQGIRPDLGRPATEAEALDHLRRCRGAGLVHLAGRNRLDTLWLGVGPPEKLFTVCSCCSCCCLWRFLPDLHPSLSGRVMKMEGVTVSVTDACTGCGACLRNVCFVKAIRMRNGRPEIGEDCRGCGRCEEVCPEKAIRLTADGPASIRATAARLDAVADVG